MKSVNEYVAELDKMIGGGLQNSDLVTLSYSIDILIKDVDEEKLDQLRKRILEIYTDFIVSNRGFRSKVASFLSKIFNGVDITEGIHSNTDYVAIRKSNCTILPGGFIIGKI